MLSIVVGGLSAHPHFLMTPGILIGPSGENFNCQIPGVFVNRCSMLQVQPKPQ